VNRAVRDLWLSFNSDLEGFVLHMYLDVRNLVTTGMGNLVDPVGLALPLPWRHPDGSVALQAEVRSQWAKVKAARALAPFGGNSEAFRKLTSIRLSEGDVKALCSFKLAQNHAQLRTYFPDVDLWPPPAQMAVHSMAWALGAGFPSTGKWPKFCKAARARDFATCAAECEMGPKEGTIIERNRRNALLFSRAARGDVVIEWH
jgi:GH24 family phage-related lysozyme (muramidase)